MAEWSLAGMPNAPAPASYAAPQVSFAALADLPDAYFRGQQNKRTLAQQNAFQDGIPTIKNPDGSDTGRPDITTINDTLSKVGGADYVKGILPFLNGQSSVKRQQDTDASVTGVGGQPPQPSSPQPPRPFDLTGARSTQPPVPKLQSPGAAPPGVIPSQPGAQQPPTLTDLVGTNFPDSDAASVAARLGARLRLDPKTPLDPAAIPRVAQFMRTMQGDASGQVMIPGEQAGPQTAPGQQMAGNYPAPNPSVAGGPGPQAGPAGQGSGFPPGQGAGGPQTATGAPGAADPIQARVINAVAAVLPPGVNPQNYQAYVQRVQQAAIDTQSNAADAALTGNAPLAQQLQDKAKGYMEILGRIQTAASKASELTPEEKAYYADRQPGESMTDYQGRVESSKSEATDTAKSLQKMSDAGIDAKAHEAQLATIQSLGEKVGYGIVPKIQDYLGKYGIDTNGLTDIQAYQRAIDFMAPQLRPVGSGRLLQNELNAFKGALGGMMTTPDGRRITVANLKLLSQYQQQVGAIAADQRLPPGKRMQQIYAIPPPKLNVEIPQGPQGPQGSPGAVGAPQSYSSPAAAKAAVAAGQLNSGDVFLGPQGERRTVP